MALLERSKHFQLKDPRSREHAKRTTLSMINAERYCTFVKVIRPLSPEARPRSCRRAPLLCLPLFHGRKRWGRAGGGGRVTPPHMLSSGRLAVLSRFRVGFLRRAPALLLLKAPAADGAAAAAFMWLLQKKKIHQTASVTHI